MKTLKVKQ